MNRYTIILMYCLIFTSCKTKEQLNNVSITPDNTFSKEWKNISEYTEAQDYVKNLDYSILEKANTHPVLKEILKITKGIIDGDGLSIMPDIQKAIDSTENKTIQSIYNEYAMGLLIEEGKYKAVTENFDDVSDLANLVKEYASFPKEALIEISEPIKQLKLDKAKIGYAQLRIKANNVSINAFFDTGMDFTSISESYAKKLGVVYNKDKGIKMHTSNSIHIFGYAAYIEELEIGNVIIKNHPVLVLDDRLVNIDAGEVSIKLDFTIGWNIIRNLEFILDFRDNYYETKISQKTNNGFKNLFWLGYPGIKVNSMEGQSLIFGFDTGARRTELSFNILNKIKLSNVTDQMLTVGGLGGIESIEGKVASNVSFLVAKQKISFKKIEILEGNNFSFIAQDGIIGSDVFLNNRITIDYKNGIFKME